MLYLFQKLNKTLLISFTGLILVIGSPQGWTTEISEPEFIKNIWTEKGNIGPQAATITTKINDVRQALRETYDENKQYNNQSKGIITEAASVAFFEVNGWQPWNNGNCNLGKCFGDKIDGYVEDNNPNVFQGKGKDNGIDGLFTKIILGQNYLIINESKFRSGNKVNLLKDDFGKLVNNTRQSSSEWNKEHLQQLGFTGVQVNSATFNGTPYNLVRSGTFLNNKGDFKLYFISNENSGGKNKNILEVLNENPTSGQFVAKVTQAINYIKK